MARTAKTMRLLGGRLCLDFANSADWHGREVALDMLGSYADVVDLGERLSLISGADAKALRARAKASPESADEALERVKRARAELYAVFDDLARGAPPTDATAAALDRGLSETAGRVRVRRSGSRVSCAPADDDLAAWLLGPVYWSAADLLLSPDLERLRVCPGNDCEWLFVDASRNGTRRWCSMETCGNRAKARAFYGRKSEAGS